MIVPLVYLATFAAIAALVCGALLLLVRRTGFGRAVHRHIPERPSRRMFLASISFFFTFAGVRTLAWANHNHIGPFHDVYYHGRHIHHLVWGILLLLLIGYGWLAEVGTGEADSSILLSQLMSLLYGAGAALTLDEFALWLNLQDVYWARQGRASIDAGIAFLALLLIGSSGAPFWRGIFRRTT